MTSRSSRRWSRWAAPAVVAIVLGLPWVVPPLYAPRMPVATPYLPFELVQTKGPRKVFAHYMPSLPISIDNKDPKDDYYATQYLTVNGEGGKHSAYGGFLRDRPLPRPHSDKPDWKLEDLKTEIGQAKSVGIDGFAVDVIDPHTDLHVVDRMLKATTAVGNFAVLLTADLTGPFGTMTPADFAAAVAQFLAAPGAFHLADNRAVLGAFAAERQPPAWWETAFNILRDKFKVSVAFVPTFLNPGDNLEKFAPFSYGFSMWGGRSPRAMAPHDTGRGSPVDVIRRTRKLGKIWMQPVAFQDSRPRSGTFEESANGLANRLAWQLADTYRAEWVQLITWNDYAESTAMAPSVVHGWRILDMNAYDIATFKAGKPPPIVRDALYVSYRVQPVSARPLYPESTLMQLVPASAPARDTIEIVAFATAPSQVHVEAGAQNYSCAVPAGRAVCVFPLNLGSIAVVMQRDGVVVASARSDADVTDTPYVQDLQYRVVGGLR
jgi:hypothetical protein